MQRFSPYFLLLCLLFLAGCASETTSSGNDTAARESGNAIGGGSGMAGGESGPVAGLRILSGSENKTLEPIVQRWATENKTTVQMDYKGSVDIMLRLQDSGPMEYDAVWPANSLWIALGDTQKRVKDEQSIVWSPVVFGVKKSVAERLGWTKKPVKVDDILTAAESGKLRFMMTSATQSNSGAVAYLGFLSAFAGSPQVLTSADLKKPVVADKIRRILGSVERSSGSSGWLKDLFLEKYDNYDAMVNYEAVIIEANQQLTAEGREPLYAVYPTDGQAIADSPLAYVDNGDAAKREAVKRLQEYLLSEPVQKEIQSLGRRIGPVGEAQTDVNTALFNPAWGIQTDTFLNQLKYPKASVLREALELYQTAFRKPSFTVYCLDYSGSMRGDRIADLKTAMQMMLDQKMAQANFLQASPRDVTVVVTFAGDIKNEWRITGNNPQKLQQLLTKIETEEVSGGTDIYSPVIRALEICQGEGKKLENYFPAVILMTDGESNRGRTFVDFAAIRATMEGTEVPVFGIQFGEASESQLKKVTEETAGRTFDGRKDLTNAFREAKGYN